MNSTQETDGYKSLDWLTDVCTILSCVASILGAGAIFLLYYRYPVIRTPSKTMLVFLTIADLLTATGNLVGISRYIVVSAFTPFEIICNADGTNPRLYDDIVCVIQSFVTTFSSLASLYWTAAISFFIMLPTAKEGLVLGKRFTIACHMICWSVPGVIAIVAISMQKLGSDNIATSSGWCWIDRCVRHKLVWMLVTGKGWEIAIYLITAVNYILLKFNLVKMNKIADTTPVWERHPVTEERGQPAIREEDKRFIFVPFLLYFLRMWGTVRFFLDRWDVQDDYNRNFVLLTLQGIGDSAQAFVNFIVFFACDRSIRRQVTMDIGSRLWTKPLPIQEGEASRFAAMSDSYSY